MNTAIRSSLLFTGLVGLSAIAPMPSAIAETTVTTPVGYVTLTVPAGTSILSLPLQKQQVAAAAVTSINGDVIGASIGELPDGNLYVQVTQSENALGKYATVMSSGTDSITISPAIDGLSVGDYIAVRPHFTLSDLVGTPLYGNGSTVTIYEADGSHEAYTFYRTSATTGNWYGFDESNHAYDASNVAVFPSEGIVISNATGQPCQIVVSGAVSVDTVNCHVGSGFSIIGTNSPSSSVTVAEAFANLPANSTITYYSNDGKLTKSPAITVYDYNGQKYFYSNAKPDSSGELVPAGTGVVISVPGSSTDFLLPPAYTAE